MTSINQLAVDYDRRQRQLAQVALLFPGIDPNEIERWTSRSRNGNIVLEITLTRPVSRAQIRAIADGAPLLAHPEAVAEWTQGHAAEYRRQYDAKATTGSFAPAMHVHPDQVDLWIAEANR